MEDNVIGPHPPWLAAKLLSSVLRSDERDALLGDLCEEHAARASVSAAAAARWYWNQAVRSLPILLGRRARHGRWISTLAIAMAAYVVVGALNAIGTFLVAGRTGGSVVPSHVVSAVVGLIAIGSGAHLASRMRSAAGDVLGGLVFAVAVAMLLFPVDASPAWYQLLFLTLGPLAARLGSATATPTRSQRS